MAYVTIPTVSDGATLSASYLNLVAANIGFVYGVANQSNPPFNSFRSTHVTLDKDIMIWAIRHKVQYLHWKITSQGGAWNYARLYMDGLGGNGLKLGQGAVGTSWQGVFNLWQFAGLPNLVGAWASGVAYDDDINGDGVGGNSDDGAVVSEAGSYYRCRVAHTSSAATRPNSGASWTTVWDGLILPAVNTMHNVWADVNFNSGTEVTVEFILETDAPSF
jgi:hypothetical protein